MTTEEFEKYLESIGGFENGWYPDREPILNRGICWCDDGWLQLIHDLIEELLAVGWNKQIKQIKEKFGGLRFYIGNGSEEIFNIISKYESLSYETCEVCGEPGQNRNDCGWGGRGWYKTMCDDHYIKLKEERKNER